MTFPCCGPRWFEAENYTDGQGARLVVTANRQRPTFAEEPDVLLEFGDEDPTSFVSVNLYGIDALSLRVVPEAHGSVEVRLLISDPGGMHEQYFVSSVMKICGPERGTVAKFDQIEFEEPGVMTRAGYDVSTTRRARLALRPIEPLPKSFTLTQENHT
ncbi:MAG: hypothetical protein ACR2GR_07410 [Rhodothermales bacterium]